MKPQAILYTSHTGSTARYAELLGQKTGLPVFPLSRAPARGTAVLYLGWLMAGKVQGYRKAAKKYRICALCGVGMGPTGSQLDDVKKANQLPPDLPLFTLQGGFDRSKLRGVYRLMMSMVAGTMGKTLAEKPDRTPEEAEMLELLTHGGNRVSEEHLHQILAWYETI